MNNKTSAGSLFKPLGKFFRKYHLTLFFILVIGCLALAVMMISRVISEPPVDDDYVSPITPGTIDEATLQRIQSLHGSSEPSPAQSYPGRINPFGE
jgi:hypothetical protein